MKASGSIIVSAVMLISAAFSFNAHAQESAVETKLDTKTIHVDKLGLPSTLSASAILKILPELLERPNISLTSNYDIQVEDMSVGDAADAALTQICLGDIETIEVSDSPTASYKSNGQAGSIKIKLKNREDDEDGFWGKAAIQAMYQPDIIPTLQLNYLKKGWTIKSLLLGEYYKNDDRTEMFQTFASEYARLLAKYSKDGINTFTFQVSEDFSKDNIRTEGINSSDTTDSRNVSIDLLGKYEHLFGERSKLNVTLQYGYNPNKNWQTDFDAYTVRKDERGHSMSAQVESQSMLLPDGSKGELKLTAGTVFNGKFLGQDMSTRTPFTYNNEDFGVKFNTYHLMPYVKLSGRFGKFGFLASGNYQYYRYDIFRKDYDSYSQNQHDFTGQLFLTWFFNDIHRLRFIADRSIDRPEQSQIFPYLYYSPSDKSYAMGNSDLKPVYTNKATVEYISNYQWGEHNFTMEAGVSYEYVNGLITASKSEDSQSGGMLGSTLQYISFDNQGEKHLVIGNLAFLYRYGGFALTLSGNASNVSGNISLLPSYTFYNGWYSTLSISYYSRSWDDSIILDDFTLCTFNFGKRWDGIEACILARVPIAGNLIPWSVGATAIFNF